MYVQYMPAYSCDRVRALLHGQVELAACRLGRCFQAVAAGVVQPAVIGAGDAALLDPSIQERGAAVGAMVSEQADVAALVAEEDQVLAQQPHELGGRLS